MRRILFFVAVLLSTLPLSSNSAFAEVRVFACEPEWASLAQSLGGDLVETYSATHAKQDPHYIRARPSLIAQMRKADLIICSGAGLEAGWLPVLIHKAGNPVAQPGHPNFLLVAELVPLLEAPTNLDRAMGDLHAQGNPHVHLNPSNIQPIAAAIALRLSAIDEANRGSYNQNHLSFSDRWNEAALRWEKAASALKGQRIVTHHGSWAYLIDWLDLDLVNTLEPKPGIPPSTGHLERLMQQVDEAPVLAIVRTPYAPGKASKWLSDKTETPAVILPYTVGGEAGATDLISLFDRTLEILNGALNAKP